MNVYRGRNFYPPEGHDWVATDGIRRAAQHNEALEDAAYHYDIGAFRRRFFDLLIGQGAFDGAFGWAIYDQPGNKEVLLATRYTRHTGLSDYPVPQLRIITNESYQSEHTYSYLTEDMTIAPNNKATYFCGTVELGRDDPNISMSTLTQSLASLFWVQDGKLIITKNNSTPVVSVRESPTSWTYAHPFGESDSMVDKLYALEKATEIVDSVSESYPRYTYEAK